MPEVEIYTTMFCPYCARARALLERKGVDYTEIDIIEEPTRRDEMIRRAGGRTTVPQIFIDGEHIGGCDELVALDRAGKLDPKLGIGGMSGPFTAACVQLTAGPDIEPNLRQVADLVRRARDAGADFIMTPEVSNLIESGRRRREKARREAEEPFLAGMRELARETGAWLLLGSLVIDPAGEPGGRSRREPARQPLVSDRRRRRDRRALRQDPHVRHRSAGRRKLPREQRLPPRRCIRSSPRRRGAGSA